MPNRTHINSLYLQLSIIIILAVVFIFGVHSFYIYTQTKNEVDNQIKTQLTRNIESIKRSIGDFMDAYSPNEYQKIIVELVKKQNIQAVIVNDYKLQKILREDNYRVGYIKDKNTTIEIDFNDPKQMALLSNPYYKKTIEITNKQEQKIGKITFFISNEVINSEIQNIIQEHISLAVLSAVVMSLILFLSIKYFILNHLTRIVKVVSNVDQYGVPLGEIQSQGSFEIRYIIDTINKMIETIRNSQHTLQENYELLQSEKDRFQLTIEATNDGIWDWNLVTDEVFYSNRWKSMLGYSENEIANDMYEWEKRIHPDDLKSALEALDAHLAGKTSIYENEFRMQHKDEHWIWILDRGKALFDENDKAYRMLGFHTDVTQQHTFNDSLKAEQKRYKSLLELSSDGIHLIDEDGKLYDCSKSFLKMLGYTIKEAENLYVTDWDPTVPIEKIKFMIQQLKYKSKSFERIHKRKNGTMFIASLNAKGIEIDGKQYLYVSARDVTKEKEHQLEIRKKLQKVIDTQSSILIVTDSKKLTFANKAFLEFFGYKNLESYLENHNCISEKFLVQEKFFNLNKIQEGEKTWIESLQNLSGRQRVVAMKNIQGMVHAFSISINRFEYDQYIVNFSDISDTITENFELIQQATIDTLTNAYNRMYFYKNIDYILKRNAQRNMDTGVIMFDIDKFKDVNDTYGHDIGDYVLKTLVNIAQRNTRKNDVLIRWGGEEFIVLCAINDMAKLEKISEHLRASIAHYKFDYVERVTCSFGCTIHDSNENILQTIKESDRKLYKAKESGRNKVICS